MKAAIACLLLLISCGAGSSTGTGFSNGMRTGVVVKLSKKGTMVKGWEGQLMIGSHLCSGKDGAGPFLGSHLWAFSISGADVDKKILAELQAALRDGKRRILHYKQFHVAPLAHDTSYLINEVESPDG